MGLLSVCEPERRVEDIDDVSLTSCVTAIAANERELRAEFIIHLAEFDRRRLYLRAGFRSLFVWLTDHLRFSKSSAYRRVTAARLQARMPAVAAYLREGRLSLTKLCSLRDVLEPENCLALLEQAASLTEEEVVALALVLDPRRAIAPPRDSIKPIAVTQQLDLSPPGLPAPPAPQLPLPPVPASSVLPPPALAPPPAPAQGKEIKHVIRMTVGPEFMELLEQVKGALSNTFPNPSLETLFSRCMRAAISEHTRRVKAETDRPRERRATRAARSRHIPANVRREVWRRDGDRCTFTSSEGQRCDARHFLHVHHDDPFARGGPATTSNCRVMCSIHNDLLARVDFGDEHMDRARAGQLKRRS